MTNAILLTMLLAPHAAILLAWIFWFRSAAQPQFPRWRNTVMLFALLAGTLNIIVFWGYVVWLQRHFNTESWRGRDLAFGICEYLIGFTFVGGFFGRGRMRAAVCAAGVLGFFLWVTTAIGIL